MSSVTLTIIKLFPIIANRMKLSFSFQTLSFFFEKSKNKKNGFDLFVHLIIMEAQETLESK